MQGQHWKLKLANDGSTTLEGRQIRIGALAIYTNITQGYGLATYIVFPSAVHSDLEMLLSPSNFCFLTARHDGFRRQQRSAH